MTHSLTYRERIVALFGAIMIAVLFAVGAAFPAHAATINSYMGMGMSSADVTNLQAFLAADQTVYPEGLITGYFGPLTEAAVVRFQSRNGIPATGYVGPLTLAAINSQSFGGGTGGSDDEYAPIISLVSLTSDITCGAPNNGTSSTTNVTTSGVTCVNSTNGIPVSSNPLTVTWVTNEDATGRVMYGTSWPFLYATAASATDGTNYSTLHRVTLPALAGNTHFYYVLESEDISGNLSYSTPQLVRTQ